GSSLSKSAEERSFGNGPLADGRWAPTVGSETCRALTALFLQRRPQLIPALGPYLDDRFHETGIDETGSMELEGCWWIPRLRLAERGAVSWQDGVKRSRWRSRMRTSRG